MSLPRGFASDNTSPAHPAVFAALLECNVGAALPYGADPWTARAVAWFRSQFGDDTEAFLVWNGTGANVLSLRRPSNGSASGKMACRSCLLGKKRSTFRIREAVASRSELASKS